MSGECRFARRTPKAQWAGGSARRELAPRIAEPFHKSVMNILVHMPRRVLLTAVIVAAFPLAGPAQRPSPASRVVLNDVHFHLTNYVQRGPDIKSFLKLMGD